MAKKLVKDYTPEQLWKLERRVMMQDIQRNPESSMCFEKVLEDLTEAAKAHKEAERFKQASVEMGQAAFKKWCDENPLSQRAAMHLPMIEREIVAPDLEIAKNRRENQKKFREYKQKLEEDKHKQWRKWQADKAKCDPQFARQSKQEQAKRLKNIHGIAEEIGTIAKRLDPLPSR